MRSHNRWFILVVFPFVFTTFFGLRALPAHAQGKPDIVWMKGLGQIHTLSYSADGTLQAQVSDISSGGMVRIVRSSDEMVLHTYFVAQALSAGLFAFAPNGQTFSYGDINTNKVHCVRVSDGVELWSVTDYILTYSQMGYTTDSSKVFHRSQNGNGQPSFMVFRDTLTGTQVFQFGGFSAVPNPTGPEVAVNGNGTIFYDSNTGAILGSESQGQVLAYSGDGAALIIPSGFSVQAIRRSDFTGISAFGVGVEYNLAVRGRKAFVSYYIPWDVYHQFIYSWDIDTGVTTHMVDFRPTGDTQRIAVSPDGATLAVLAQTPYAVGQLSYYHTSDGSLIKQADGPGAPISSLAVAPDGSKFATGCAGGDNSDVLIWETATGALLHRYTIGTPFTRQVQLLAWAPDGVNLAVSTYELASGHGDVRIINPNDGSTNKILSIDPTVHARSLHFTNNGKFLEFATDDIGNYQLMVWNRLTDTIYCPLGVQNPVYNVVSSPDDSQVAVANFVYGVGVFNWSPLAYIGLWQANSSVRDFAWNKDGKKLAYSLSNGSAYVVIPGTTPGIPLSPYLFYPAYGYSFSNVDFDPANGRYLARGYNHPDYGDPQLGLFDTNSLSTTPVIRYDQEVGFYPLSGITRTAYTPSGQFIIYGTYAGQIVVAKNPFFITPKLLSLAIAPTSIAAGNSATGTVTLDLVAPPGGLTVNLANSNSAAATVPASVAVASGQKVGTFNITGMPIDGVTTITITASYNGVSKPKTVTITPAVLTGISINPSSVTGGTGAVGSVTVSGNVTVATVVNLSTTNTAAHVPAGVTVPAGSNTATFPIMSDPVTVATAGPIKAVLGSTNKSATFTVKPPVLSVHTITPTSVTGATVSVTGTVTMSGPVAVNTTVTLTTAVSSFNIPSSVTVPAGLTSATYTFIPNCVVSDTTGTISAAVNGVVKPVTFKVLAPKLLSFVIVPNPVKGGMDCVGTVTLTGPACVDMVVTLTNANAKAMLPSPTVTILAGNSSVSFTITTMSTPSNVSGSVKAQVGTVTKSVTLKVTP